MSKKNPQTKPETNPVAPTPSTLKAGEAESTRADILASASDAERARVAGEAEVLYPIAPDTNTLSTPTLFVAAMEREQLLLRAAQAEEYALATEERLEKHLAEARARIAELEITATRARMLDDATIERIRDIGRPRDWSENQTVLAALDELRILPRRVFASTELREAAQRLRASTLPESDVVADAIRTLVEHHDPQDPTP